MKHIVITGATSGIGRAAARELLRRGHSVTFLSRSRERGESALERFITDPLRPPSAAVSMIPCDLGSLAQVRCAAQQLLSTHPRIDVLINNAGTYSFRRAMTEDGFELAFGVNHVGHFLLTELLLDRLMASAPARIVVVASAVHRFARLDFDEPEFARRPTGWGAYCRSKLANVLFSRELAARLDPAAVTVNSLHPGTVATAILSGRRDGLSTARRFIQVPFRVFFRSPAKGAETVVHLAISPEVAGVTGRYFFDRQPVAEAPHARDAEAAARLRSVTEALIARAGARVAGRLPRHAASP